MGKEMVRSWVLAVFLRLKTRKQKKVSRPKQGVNQNVQA